MADWALTKWDAKPRPYQPVPDERAVAGFALVFEMRRKAGHYVFKIILPLILIVAMAWAVFWIDPTETGTNIGLASTSMLTLIAYRFAIGAQLPDISYMTRMDSFILGSTLLVFLVLMQVVITNSFVARSKVERARWVDRWCRWVYPVFFLGMGLNAFVSGLFL